jgi:hypothetical protein
MLTSVIDLVSYATTVSESNLIKVGPFNFLRYIGG